MTNHSSGSFLKNAIVFILVVPLTKKLFT